jgi:hypothetical protein
MAIPSVNCHAFLMPIPPVASSNGVGCPGKNTWQNEKVVRKIADSRVMIVEIAGNLTHPYYNCNNFCKKR